METTTARVHDTRWKRTRKVTIYPLAIRVTHNRTPVKFPIGIEVSIEDFRKLDSPRLGERLSTIRERFIQEEERAKRIIATMGTFTFQAFREQFYKDRPARLGKKRSVEDRSNHQINIQPHSSPAASASEGKNKKYGKRKFDRIRSNVNYAELGPLAVAFGEYIKQLESQERIGTMENYFTSLTSLLAFKKGLRLEDITPEFLFRYERWMLNKGNSTTTIGIYVRCLRAIINLRPNKRLFNDDTYPFGRGQYIIPTGVNIKKALTLAEIKKLYDYQPETETKDTRNELYARDIWFFGFFASGINPNDIAHLQFRNIDPDGYIIIQRQKTRFTTRSKPRPLIIPINDDMKRIMEKWGDAAKSPNNYVFPVLRPGLSAHRRYELVQAFIGTINDWINKIAAKVGITKRVRTMEYRHSMATILKRSGASTSFIQEVLGHTDVKTTENYLDNFELDVKKQYLEQLSSFKYIAAAT